MPRKKDKEAMMTTEPIEVAKAKAKAIRSSSFQRVMDKMEGWKPAPEVLLKVRAVPTIFPQFDYVDGIGGLPLERVTVVTGPSNMGKSAFALGLAASFVRGEHVAGYMDAENTTSIDWAKTLMDDVAEDPRFLAMRPRTFEEAVEGTRRFCNMIAESREAGDLPEGAAGLVVVDSLRKLVPAKIMKELEKESIEAGVDGMSGRAGQIRALYNAAWLDELVPLMASTGCAVVLIVREVDDPNADPWDKKFGNDYKITGGKALIFESSLILRITRASWVTDKKVEGQAAKIFGERHRVTIVKTKVAGKEDRQPSGFFHTSNGVLVPEGFDHARDVLDLALTFGIVQKSGSWFNYGEEKLGQGANNVVVNLTANPALMDKIETEVRAKFETRDLVKDDELEGNDAEDTAQ